MSDKFVSYVRPRELSGVWKSWKNLKLETLDVAIGMSMVGGSEPLGPEKEGSPAAVVKNVCHYTKK